MNHSEKRQSTEVTLGLFVPKIVRATCRITYEVMPFGSDRLYQLRTVETVKGEPLDPQQVERLNPTLDRQIANAIHGDYAKEELGYDPAKKKRKCKKKIKDPDHPILPL